MNINILSIKMICFTVLVFIAVLVCAPVGHAGDVSKIEPLAEVAFIPAEDFEEKTSLIEETPFGDELLGFSIRLPKDWVPEKPPLGNVGLGSVLNNKVLREVARYVSPQRFNLRSFFTIQAMMLDYEISAQDWLVHHLFRNGSTINSMTATSPKEVEAVYVVVRGDTTYAVRVKAVVNGARIILGTYFVPQEDYKTERSAQAQSIAGFKLLKPQETGGVEAHKTYAFLDQSYFNYPVSWTLQARIIKSIERMNVLLFRGVEQTEDEEFTNPDGQIRIRLVSKLLETKLSDEIKSFREKLQYSGYQLGRVIESKSYTYDEAIRRGRAEVYALEPQQVTMIPYEIVVSVAEGNDYYYLISMLTPSRETNYYEWARNMEGLRIVIETMRRTNAGAIEDDPYYDFLEDEGIDTE